MMSKEQGKIVVLATNNKKTTYVNTSNGLYLNSTYFPEEMITLILSYIDADFLLQCSLVCRKWNAIIKSHSIWAKIYERKCDTKAKNLPWYLYFCLFSSNCFNRNLLRNGNGEEGLNHWKLKVWEGDDYVEKSPMCANVLPKNVPEFNNNESCLVTSYFSGFKSQLIQLPKNKLFRYILNSYKPNIYLSEWTTARNDCSCVYKLQCSFVGEDYRTIATDKPFACYYKPQWQEGKWEKIDILIVDYPDDINSIIVENEGSNTQSWKGHYGCKMAGGVVKILFNSIEPLDVDRDGNVIPKKYDGIKFFSNSLPQDKAIDYFQCDYLWNDNNEECYYFMP